MSALPEERYHAIEDIEALPEGERAELIDGQICMMTASKRMHQRIRGKIHQVINNHIDEAGLECEACAAPSGVWLDADHVEPDISVICDMDKLDDDGCKGAPDLVIEIISKGNTWWDGILTLAVPFMPGSSHGDVPGIFPCTTSGRA